MADSFQDALGPVHLAKLVEIWNGHAAEGIASFDRVRRAFSAYLQPFAAELSDRGLDMVYTAYIGAYLACRSAGAPIPAHVQQIFDQMQRGVLAKDMTVDAPKSGADDIQSFAEGLVRRMLEDDVTRN